MSPTRSECPVRSHRAYVDVPVGASGRAPRVVFGACSVRDVERSIGISQEVPGCRDNIEGDSRATIASGDGGDDRAGA